MKCWIDTCRKEMTYINSLNLLITAKPIITTSLHNTDWPKNPLANSSQSPNLCITIITNNKQFITAPRFPTVTDTCKNDTNRPVNTSATLKNYVIKRKWKTHMNSLRRLRLEVPLQESGQKIHKRRAKGRWSDGKSIQKKRKKLFYIWCCYLSTFFG